MDQHSAHSTFWQTTDFMIAVVFVAGFALDYVLPLDVPLFIGSNMIFVVAAFLIVAGAGVIVLAKKAFRQASQPSAPGQPTTRIVSGGIFRYSRNPLYVGIVVAMAGAGLAFNNGWIVLFDIPLVIVIHIFLILPEERYLIRIFGDEYRIYMKRVRRWL